MSEIVQGITDRVRKIAEPIATQAGLELVDVEYLRESGRWVLRVYIDKPGGVGLDDCQDLSRHLETVLDVEDVVGNAYSLEVSSPGLERPLRTRPHYERYVGRDIELRTFAPLGDPPRKNYKGRLVAIDPDDTIRLEIDGKEYQVPLAKVAKAHLSVDYDALAADLKASKAH